MEKIEKKDYNMEELIKYNNKYIQVDEKNTIKNLSEFIIKGD